MLIFPYAKNEGLFACPTTLSYYGYQFNERLHGMPLARVLSPAQTLALYETGFLDRSAKAPHRDGYTLGFADGHCKQMPAEAARTVTVQP
jgi:prepilin-type processing-associated H-X9-DG protein